MPRGLQEGEEAVDAAEGEDGMGRAKFEGRRQRESRREKNGKQKVVKGGKDWILRKKDVRGARQICRIFVFIDLSSNPSCTGDEERTTCLATQNTLVAKEEQYSRMLSIQACTVLYSWHAKDISFYCRAAKSSLVDATASFASCLMNMPCKAAILTR